MSRDVETSKIVDGILKVLLVAGIAGTVVIAPNAIQAFEPILKHMDKRSRRRELHRVMHYMAARRQLLEYRELTDGYLEVKITEKGKQQAEKVLFEELRIPRPKRWDGKWRLVLFDVPESRRKARLALSYKLRLLGLYQLQKSVWVYPYACEREIELVRQVYGLHNQDIIMGEISNFYNEPVLKKHFKLHA